MQLISVDISKWINMCHNEHADYSNCVSVVFHWYKVIFYISTHYSYRNSVTLSVKYTLSRRLDYVDFPTAKICY